LVLGYGARGLSFAFLASSWATLAVAAALLGRALPRAFAPAPRHWQLWRLLRFSLPQTLTTLLLQTILWTDTVLLGRLRPAAAVGVYTIVQRLLSPAQTVSTAAAITLVNLLKLVQVRSLFAINPFRAETMRALGAGALATGAVAPFAMLVAWPSPALQVLVVAAVLMPLYGTLFWWSAAGVE